MQDTPTTLARAMLAEVGRADALIHLVRLLPEARSWREAWNVMLLIGAVLAA